MTNRSFSLAPMSQSLRRVALLFGLAALYYFAAKLGHWTGRRECGAGNSLHAARSARRRSRARREYLGARRYPNNPVFQRFLRETAYRMSASERVRATAGAATAAIARPAVGRRKRRQLAEHVVHVTLHR